MSSEGYVKYRASHTLAPAPETPLWPELNEARTKLHALGLVGVTPQGIGFGNVSVRVRGDTFLVSGTATGAVPVLTQEHYCLVTSFDIADNSLASMGPVAASSESMTHGAVYRGDPGVNCVIHIHSRAIFDGMIHDQYPATPENAGYGTPEIAAAAGVCVRAGGGSDGLIVLAGHDEGIIAYGQTVAAALNLILELNGKYGQYGV
jgi:ribulose-5-phosphate 4-epimerase/fuculose-1-phosphate aldolase